MCNALTLAAALPAGIADWAILFILVAAVVAIAVVAVRTMGIPIPGWVWTILGIILVAVVAILAIKFLVTWV